MSPPGLAACVQDDAPGPPPLPVVPPRRRCAAAPRRPPALPRAALSTCAPSRLSSSAWLPTRVSRGGRSAIL
eukprot:356567-Chlamydomonas_euryale.AAC.10